MIRDLLRRWRDDLRRHYYQRNYYKAKFFPPKVPRRDLSFLPDGFAVYPLGNSGAYVVEQFCSTRGTSYLLAVAAELMDEKASGEAEQPRVNVFSATRQDSVLLPLLYRAGMLTGLPAVNAGPVSVASVRAGESLAGRRYPRSQGQPVSHFCFFLADEGEIRLPELGLSVAACKGRAVFWPEGVVVEAGDGSADSWFAGFVMESRQAFQLNSLPELIPQAQRGVPLDGSEALPEGADFIGVKPR